MPFPPTNPADLANVTYYRVATGTNTTCRALGLRPGSIVARVPDGNNVHLLVFGPGAQLTPGQHTDPDALLATLTGAGDLEALTAAA